MSDEADRPTESGWEAVACQIKQRQDAAIERFATEFGPRLWRFFRWYGLSATDAEELAVDCVGDLVLAIESFDSRGAGSFERWCLTVARNKFYDRKRRHVSLEHVPADMLDVFPSTVAQVSTSPLQPALEGTVSRLAAEDREVLLLRHDSWARSFKDIGEILGISETAARTRYHRARRRLELLLRAIPEVQCWLERKEKGCEVSESGSPS